MTHYKRYQVRATCDICHDQYEVLTPDFYIDLTQPWAPLVHWSPGHCGKVRGYRPIDPLRAHGLPEVPKVPIVEVDLTDDEIELVMNRWSRP